MERTITEVVFQTPKPINVKRVAAYARVSSGKDAMLHSLSAQVSYYSDMIQKHPGWLYRGVYADEALTGTKEERESFQRMLSACRNGELDMIITKSISRFARNTVTLLQSIRELKELGVDVFFEEQNIHTMSADGELMITILASYAQEESRSASENQKWRIQKNFKDGRPWNNNMYGYRQKDGILHIVEEEAAIVRQVFGWYLSGMGYATIRKRLQEDGVRNRTQNDWSEHGIECMLKNYAYTGNLLLQRRFRQDHISKKDMYNRGELPMYQVRHTHEPIITEEVYEAAQEERARRAEKHRGKAPAVYPFTRKIVCQRCGKYYKRKMLNSHPVWICRTYDTKGKAACPSKAIPEKVLEDMTADMDISDLTAVCAGDNNTLVFQWADGTETVKRWQDRSRADSWTPEMRAAASIKAKEWRKNHA